MERTFPGEYIFIHMRVVIKLTFKCINVTEVDIQENILHNKCKRQPLTKFQSICPENLFSLYRQYKPTYSRPNLPNISTLLSN